MTTIRHRIRELTQQNMRPVSTNAEITSIRSIAPSYTRVTLTSSDLARYEPTLPADGIKIAVPGKDGAPEIRAMTVSRRPLAHPRSHGRPNRRARGPTRMGTR